MCDDDNMKRRERGGGSQKLARYKNTGWYLHTFYRLNCFIP